MRVRDVKKSFPSIYIKHTKGYFGTKPCEKIKTTVRPVKFDENFARPLVFERPFATRSKDKFVRLRWYNIRLFRFCLIMDLSTASKEKELGEYPAILNSAFINNTVLQDPAQ